MYSFSGHEIAAFRNAQPFPHLVVDGFLRTSIAEDIADELLALPDDAWKWKNAGDGRTLHKGSINNSIMMPKLARETLLYLNSEAHLDLLRDLTGIEGLAGDPGAPDHFEGGGFHRIDRGGRLGVHVDFNTLKDRPTWRRRLNLLVYLNLEWNEAWGGHLGLYEETLVDPENPWMKCHKKIAPVFNRAVIFETSDHSWHGHPEPLTCPADRHRISMACYFYSLDDAPVPHKTTVYR